VNCIHGGIYDVAANGIYYAECDEDMNPRIHRLDPKTGRDQRSGRPTPSRSAWPFPPTPGPSCFTKVVGFGND
jgi:hypothetical protein